MVTVAYITLNLAVVEITLQDVLPSILPPTLLFQCSNVFKQLKRLQAVLFCTMIVLEM
jgi:hypothetical protein